MLGTAPRRCSRDDGRQAILASKFAPYPTRLVGAQIDRALDATLERMARDSIDLYYVHFPYIRAVGVSNYNVSQMRRAGFDCLTRRA
jgi:aryl-alcohol dehydrogenase-like predicted oxidoreductase